MSGITDPDLTVAVDRTSRETARAVVDALTAFEDRVERDVALAFLAAMAGEVASGGYPASTLGESVHLSVEKLIRVPLIARHGRVRRDLPARLVEVVAALRRKTVAFESPTLIQAEEGEVMRLAVPPLPVFDIVEQRERTERGKGGGQANMGPAGEPSWWVRVGQWGKTRLTPLHERLLTRLAAAAVSLQDEAAVQAVLRLGSAVCFLRGAEVEGSLGELLARVAPAGEQGCAATLEDCRALGEALAALKRLHVLSVAPWPLATPASGEALAGHLSQKAKISPCLR